jgi:hypothetical protein
MVPVPKPTKKGMELWRRGFQKADRKVRFYWQPPWEWERVISAYTGGKLKVYQAALESLRITPLDGKDSHVKAFVKADKLDLNAKPAGKPRMIQARDPRFNIVIGSYLKPIEHAIYNAKFRRGRFAGLRCTAKTRNAYQRAADLRKAYNRIGRPYIYLADARVFDAHLHYLILCLQHKHYAKMMPYSEFEKLLKLMRTINATTMNGMRYFTKGRMASGDFDTASGNTYVVIAMLSEILSDCYTYNDGDDCVIMSEVELDKSVVTGLSLSMGMELDFTGPFREFEDIVFCRSKPVKLENGWKMVRDPRAVINTWMVGYRFYNNPETAYRYAATLAMAAKGCFSDEPATGLYAAKLAEKFTATPLPVGCDPDLAYKINLWQSQTVTKNPELYRSRMEMAWGDLTDVYEYINNMPNVQLNFHQIPAPYVTTLDRAISL